MNASDFESKLGIMTKDIGDLSMAMYYLGSHEPIRGYGRDIEDFRELQDSTRLDAVVYVKGVLPVATKFVSKTSDIFHLYKDLDYKDWYKRLEYIIQEVKRCKALSQTLLAMHEELLVSLKRNEDQAKIIIEKFRNLQREYRDRETEYETTADRKKKWAIGLAFVPGVNLIASTILKVRSRRDREKALNWAVLRRSEERKIEESYKSLIPNLQRFIRSLEDTAGFFQGMEQELEEYECKYSHVRKSKNKLYFTMMKFQATTICDKCEKFSSAPLAIPTTQDDVRHVRKWRQEQKDKFMHRYTDDDVNTCVINAITMF
ncbi:uncharacterized protein LOC135154871 [Lytechinus pictus]|uniref:uncharacterized protein LOC135154871 n=1 Tax=Lytechinus pictus TaxID=7653 RepID=UPI0030BA0A1B